MVGSTDARLTLNDVVVLRVIHSALFHKSRANGSRPSPLGLRCRHVYQGGTSHEGLGTLRSLRSSSPSQMFLATHSCRWVISDHRFRRSQPGTALESLLLANADCL